MIWIKMRAKKKIDVELGSRKRKEEHNKDKIVCK
jgi:hypothetical protein